MKMLQVKVHTQYKNYFRDLSGGSVVKNPPSKARGVSLIPGYRVKLNSKQTNKQKTSLMLSEFSTIDTLIIWCSKPQAFRERVMEGGMI